MRKTVRVRGQIIWTGKNRKNRNKSWKRRMIRRYEIRTLEREKLQRGGATPRKGHRRGTMSNANKKKNEEQRQRKEGV